MERMKPDTEREFLEEMVRLSGECVESAQTDHDREYYAEVHFRWKVKLADFERRQQDAA